MPPNDDFSFRQVDAETAHKLCLPPGKGIPWPPDAERALAEFPGAPLDFLIQCVEDYRLSHPEDRDYDELLYRDAFTRAIRLANEGELEAAFALFERSFKFISTDALALYEAGQVALDARDFIRARRWFHLARNAGNTDVAVMEALARAEAGCENWPVAVATAEEALQRFPDRLETLDLLTTIYFHAERWGDLEARLYELLEKRPGHAGTLIKLGVFLRKTGRFQESRRFLEGVIRLDPGNRDAPLELGRTLAEEGRGDEAEATWLALLKEKPDHVETLVQLGAFCLEHARPEESRLLLDQAEQIAPHDPRPSFLLGKLFSMREGEGRLKACEAFSRTLDAKPEDYEMLTYVAIAGKELGDSGLSDRAERAIEEWQRRHP